MTTIPTCSGQKKYDRFGTDIHAIRHMYTANMHTHSPAGGGVLGVSTAAGGFTVMLGTRTTARTTPATMRRMQIMMAMYTFFFEGLVPSWTSSVTSRVTCDAGSDE